MPRVTRMEQISNSNVQIRTGLVRVLAARVDTRGLRWLRNLKRRVQGRWAKGVMREEVCGRREAVRGSVWWMTRKRHRLFITKSTTLKWSSRNWLLPDSVSWTFHFDRNQENTLGPYQPKMCFSIYGHWYFHWIHVGCESKWKGTIIHLQNFKKYTPTTRKRQIFSEVNIRGSVFIL